jgi:ubiquitin-protein ligase
MSSKRIKRILNEINELNKSKDILKENGIYIHINEEDINKIYAMIVGTCGTPYEKGFYFFEFKYPDEYPMLPPIAKYYTQGNLPNINSSSFFKVRFNPNLYVCGKVCLSMLNTWNGPGWVPTNTMTNILLAIQSFVLNNEPLRNEPGFENSEKEKIDKYTNLIKYANLKISVIQMAHKPPFPFFKDTLISIFNENREYYRDVIIKTHIENNSAPIIIESPAYSMKCVCNYENLLEELDLFDDIEEKYNKYDSKKECKSESKKEPKSESKKEPKSECKNESKNEPKSECKNESKNEPKSESNKEPKSESKTNAILNI